MTVIDLVPLVLGGFLGWTGLTKVTSRSLRERAGRTVLPRLAGDAGRAAIVLRAVGVVEVGLALGLIGFIAAPLPAVGAVVLGCAFVGYLAYARAVAPESSCGCTANTQAPVDGWAFARAGGVVVGGLLATVAGASWWSAFAADPFTAIAVTVGCVLAFAAARVPWRRVRLRVLGHPYDGESQASGVVPLAASLDLLDRSAAWESMAPVVRSGLVEHWDDDGWRFLRFAGVSDDEPVSVVFALDRAATVETAPEPAVRVATVPDTEAAPEALPTA